ncbi:trypsin-like serine peptidase [Aquimonas voraii]|uniref:PKD domain-containing protein n=1 Tax=Aquimonas voraii TaxID=265719 RepID=A0A1G6WI96_9GAMM|nr:PKD domain-containing protein [Aquimonas voraii]SDD65541.1 PKD domain-containing protein [Aquimonas voraii]
MKRTTRLSFSPCLLALFALSAGSLAQAEQLTLPSLDLAKLAAEDRGLDGKAGVPLRYGQVQDFGDKALGLPERGLHAGGSWTTAKDGRAQWWLQVEAAQARNLALHFEAFRLPAGAELRLYAAGEKTSRLVYTDADNRLEGDLRTPMLDGSSLRIELLVPQEKRDLTRLQLGSVVQGYRDPFVALTQLKSGSCNIDIACPQGDAWRPQSRSVAHYTFNSGGGSFVCTGQLVATGNPSQDVSSPRFLTAHHCVSTAAEVQSMTLYWRYESPTCRAPGSAASGQPLAKEPNTVATQSGASLLATHQPTDFTVVALNAPVPAAAEAWYTGWDRSSSAPTGAIGIHHPAGHEKRISIDNDPLTTGPSCIISGATANTHWFIGAWDEGTTEGGSSGSGLWRRDSGRLIGVLSGGQALCSNLTGFDCYGALDKGWTGGGTATTRMSDWLNRAGGSPTTQDGHGGCTAPSAGLNSTAFASGVRVGDSVSFTASASGGSGSGYVYEWDLDGDGTYERRGSANSVSLRYAKAQSGQVRLRVSDGAGCSSVVSRALDVQSARITASGGTAQQVCGNGNAGLDPGERWRLPVTLTNTGDAPLPAGAHALFANAVGGGASLFGPDSFGYRGTNSATDPGACGYGFVDIGDAPALALTPAGTFPAADDGRSSVIALGGAGFRLYGQTHTQAVMSTNGYVSFSTADTGGDFDNSCSGVMDNGGAGPRLHVLHDDLVVGSGGALRYRYYTDCPRAPIGGADQSCHVFQWDAMQDYSQTAPSGNASFQAIAYPGNGQVVYQYRRANSNAGAGATIGLINGSGSTQLQASCDTSNAAPAESAICVFDPQNLPVTSAALLLESPTVSVPALAVGASTTVELNLRVPEGSDCGAPVGLDYLATALHGQHSMQPSTVFAGQLASNCAAVSSCPAAASRPLPRRGFFNDPARDGNGLALFNYGDAANPVLGAIWYTGDRSYLSDWYTFAGPLRGGLMEASLARTRNTQPSGFAPVTSEIGRSWLASVDARTQLFAWDFGNGERGAELLSTTAGTLPYASTNHTNAWIQSGQSGWGLGIESVQLPDRALEFHGVYLFDANGQSRWLTGDSSDLNGGAVQLRSQPTHCPGCPFYADNAALAQPAGTLTRNYVNRIRATMSTSITLPAPLSGTWNRSNVEITAFGESNP